MVGEMDVFHWGITSKLAGEFSVSQADEADTKEVRQFSIFKTDGETRGEHDYRGGETMYAWVNGEIDLLGEN